MSDDRVIPFAGYTQMATSGAITGLEATRYYRIPARGDLLCANSAILVNNEATAVPFLIAECGLQNAD